MRRIRLVLAAVIACLIVGCLVVPAFAGSGGNPQWSVEGTVLSESETREVKAHASGHEKLRGGEVTVDCPTFSLVGGSIIRGSTGLNPGTGSETITFESCVVDRTSTGELIAACHVMSPGEATGTILTSKLGIKLAFQTAAAAEHEESTTDTVLKPESGTKFGEVELTGENCPSPGVGKYVVEGELAMKNTDGATVQPSHAVEAPSTSVKRYFVNKEGLVKEEKVAGLKAFGTATASFVGTAVVETTAEANWSVVR